MNLTLKEYDNIYCDKCTNYDEPFRQVEDKYYLKEDVFNKLKNFALNYQKDSYNDEDILEFIKLGYDGRQERFNLRNYVGIINLGSDLTIEILPKIDVGDKELQKRIFLKMLFYLEYFNGKVFNNSLLSIEKLDVYEVFISIYINEAIKLVKQGLKHDYVTNEENLNCLRGRLDFVKNIRYNFTHRERFYVSYDEFISNRVENRLIKSTLLKLKRISTSFDNQNKISQLLGYFEDVEVSYNYSLDFSKIKSDRNMKAYDFLLSWSKVFLFDKSFTTFSGENEACAILFPCEKIYENYVAKRIKEELSKNNVRVKIQDESYCLFCKDNKGIFKLRPDIVVEFDNEYHKEMTFILDTKWKLLNSNNKNNYGISQGDIYQMFAYSKKYDTNSVYLIYPFNSSVESLDSEEIIFQENNNGTSLKVFFVKFKSAGNGFVEDNIKELCDGLKNIN